MEITWQIITLWQIYYLILQGYIDVLDKSSIFIESIQF